MKFHSIYNQNTPEPVIIEQQNPIEFEQEMIAEHNIEESYEESQIISFDMIEREYLNELIKNGPKCSF